MKAMESSENHPIEGDVEVDETVLVVKKKTQKAERTLTKSLLYWL
jgi:hypothetical protein